MQAQTLNNSKMKTVTVNIYEFQELSKEVQEKLIKKDIEWEENHGEPLMFFEDYCQEQAEKLGFKDCKFKWSLSYNQGDGLSFDCKEFDIDSFVDEILKDEKQSVKKVLKDNLVWKIESTKRGSFALKSDIELELDRYSDFPNLQKKVDILLNALQTKYLSLCKELEKEGYEWIDSHYSEEMAKERLICRQKWYLEDGTEFSEE